MRDLMSLISPPTVHDLIHQGKQMNSSLTPITTLEVNYGCYYTGHSACGPISSSWSLGECVWQFGRVERMPYFSG